jgi:hypothetical protein
VVAGGPIGLAAIGGVAAVAGAEFLAARHGEPRGRRQAERGPAPGARARAPGRDERGRRHRPGRGHGRRHSPWHRHGPRLRFESGDRCCRARRRRGGSRDVDLARPAARGGALIRIPGLPSRR